MHVTSGEVHNRIQLATIGQTMKVWLLPSRSAIERKWCGCHDHMALQKPFCKAPRKEEGKGLEEEMGRQGKNPAGHNWPNYEELVTTVKKRN